MKKIVFLLLTLSVLISCKNDKNSEKADGTISTENSERSEKESNGLTLLKGEFVYYADAAVFQTKNEIYGVILNHKADELNNKAKPFKKEATDFVQVEIRGEITQKPEGKEGWDNQLEIKEILSVSALKTENDNLIKLRKK